MGYLMKQFLLSHPNQTLNFNCAFSTLKSFLILFFLNIYAFSANSANDMDLGDENKEGTSRRIYFNPPMFKGGFYEQIDFIATATPAYCCLAYGFMQSHKNLTLGKILGGIVAGYFLADLVSGLGHMVTDSLNPEIFPEPLAKVFRGAQSHHHDVLDVLREGIWENNKKYHIASYPFLAGSTLLRLSGYHMASEVLDVIVMLNMWTGWFHACGHGAYPRYTVITTLQKCGFLISRDRHGQHHRGNHDRSFCVISGLMNPLLNTLIGSYNTVRRC